LAPKNNPKLSINPKIILANKPENTDAKVKGSPLSHFKKVDALSLYNLIWYDAIPKPINNVKVIAINCYALANFISEN